MQHERPADHDGDVVEALEREDRARDKAPATADVIPLPFRDDPPTIDVDRLERERAAAGPRIRSTPDRLEAVGAPGRIVVAGDLVAELERQHRRAYRRRQEARARARRRRDAVIYARDLAVLAVGAGLGGIVLLILLTALGDALH